MAIEITMPKLSDTMTEGLFAAWKKKVGDRIERGDIIAEIETDKAVMELEAFASGILIQTMVQGGEHVEVGAVLGRIGNEGELAESASSPVSAPAAVSLPQELAERIKREPPLPTASPAAAPHLETEYEKASPLVRRLAREAGVSLNEVSGSGHDGRITQEDLSSFTLNRHNGPKAAEPAPLPPAKLQTAHAALTPLRQAVAETVTLSWQSIPHFSVTVEIDMNGCREITQELKDLSTVIGYNALIIKACATALVNFPLFLSDVGASSDEINIGFAVSKPDGIVVPVIRQCQRLSVSAIEREFSRLADKGRAGHLTSDEMTGGAFTVSNLGMFGVDEFTALIIPGQTAILAVGAICERAVVRNSQLAVATTMRVTLSCDHRRVDGAYAASFLAELRSILERPVSLLV